MIGSLKYEAPGDAKKRPFGDKFIQSKDSLK